LTEGMPDAVSVLLAQAGLHAAVVSRMEDLLVGSGGFVKELIAFTGGRTSVKDVSTGHRVSAADRILDELLRDELLALVPDSGGYSEEGGWFGRPWGSTVRWLLDPVDGTRPATLGGAFSVNVAALIAGAGHPPAAIGWVYVPNLSTLYRGILTEQFHECLANGQPVGAAELGAPAEIRNRYLAVNSNWRSDWLGELPLKLTAPGASSVNLTQLVQNGSDVAAVALTRYHAHDATAGLAVAVAGGCRLYALGEGPGGLGEPQDPLDFILQAHQAPEGDGKHVLACLPSVAQLLRHGDSL
jgi:fructose-1,6-bisphosphatase/inositol monophosphatase family enzyme